MRKKSVFFLSLLNYYEREKIGHSPDFFTQIFKEEKIGKKPIFSEGKKSILFHNIDFPPKGGGKSILKQ